MLFNTVSYLFIFLPIVVIIYYILPQRIRYIWLLIASYYFYMQWNAAYSLLLLFSTLSTYVGAILISNANAPKTKKCILTLCITTSLFILGLFKYLDFLVQCINWFLSKQALPVLNCSLDLLLPVGISFYTLQSLGYLIDVYKGDIPVEKNVLKYALFVSFFPQLVAGPIERSKNLLSQLSAVHKPCFYNFKQGLLLILYGLFLKIVIADRAGIFVDAVYDNPNQYGGWYVIVAALLFSIQIYCDFYGYSTIARGSALLLGITLMDNFNAPFYAKSIKEHWRRWHISLSFWFKDYLYIPLGGNRKGTRQKHRNILIVFGISGLWHGAAITYVIWGLLHAVYQIIADYLPFRKNHDFKKDNEIMKILQATEVYLLASFAFIFFRAQSFLKLKDIFGAMLHIENFNEVFSSGIFTLGISKAYFCILLLSILVLGIVDYFKYNNHPIATNLLSKNWIFQSFIFLFLFVMVIFFGCYGHQYSSQQFIYFQF